MNGQRHLTAQGNHKKKRSNGGRRVKGYLCGAFAAAALLASAGIRSPAPSPAPLNDNHVQQSAPPSPPPARAPADPAPPLPYVLSAFGTAALAVSGNDVPPKWLNMIRRWTYDMKDPAKAQASRDFLKTFDDVRGKPLPEMARIVNDRVKKYITYTTDMKQYGVEDYWAAPDETEMSHKGDCEDYAILQYAVLRYLGVPDSRLAVALVNDENKHNGYDHAVLLLNMAAADATPDFVVLNDSGPVLAASLYARPHGAGPLWSKPYAFYGAMNRHRVWYTPMGRKLENNPPLLLPSVPVLIPLPGKKGQPPAAPRPALKIS